MKGKFIKSNILSICLIMFVPTFAYAYASSIDRFFSIQFSILAAVVGIILGWVLFPYLLRLINIFVEAPLSLFFVKLVGGLLGGFLGFSLIYYGLFAGGVAYDKPSSIVDLSQTASQDAIELDGQTFADSEDLTAADAEAIKQGQIKGKRVNMREAPGLKAAVIFTFPGMENVTIHESANPESSKFPWIKVSYKDKTGWVYGQYVAEKAAAKPALSKAVTTDKSQAVPKPAGTKQGQIKGENVNMRESPDLKARVLFTFPGLEKVTIHEATTAEPGRKPWIKVSYKDITGWVYGQYVKQ